jgi:hypothetical protein
MRNDDRTKPAHAGEGAAAPRPMDAEPPWSEIAGGLGTAFGGIVLALEGAVLLPGLLPFAALTAVALLPFAVVAAVLTVPVLVAFAAWRAVSWAAGRFARL